MEIYVCEECGENVKEVDRFESGYPEIEKFVCQACFSKLDEMVDEWKRSSN